MTTDTNHAESIADDRRLAQCVAAENAEIAADLQRMDEDIAYRTAVYREWREQRGQLQRSKRLHELAEERIEQLEAAAKRTAVGGLTPPVVGHRFRRRDGSEVVVVVAVLSSGRVMYTDGTGDCYDPDGGCYGPTGHDLIEDLGPAGGEA